MKDFIKKYQKYLPVVYILFLVTFFAYVNKLKKSDEISIQTLKDTEEKVEEVKPVKVYLQVINGNNIKTYEARLTNQNTLDDFLENEVKESGLTFEKTLYTYGTEYTEVNGVKSNEDYKWKVYKESEDISTKNKREKLTDNTTYKFVYTKVRP